MQKTQAEIETLAAINQQLRQEGAHKQIIAIAESLAKGQFGGGKDDRVGAVKLVIDALALMLVRSPIRPTCCKMCEVEYIRNSLQVLALCYSGALGEEKNEGKANGNTKPH